MCTVLHAFLLEDSFFTTGKIWSYLLVNLVSLENINILKKRSNNIITAKGNRKSGNGKDSGWKKY